MWQINILTGIFLLILGIIIIKFKMSYLIAGYNTSSKEQKEKYDERKLVIYIGNFLIISSMILISGGVLTFIFKKSYFIFISWILFTVYIIVMLVYLNVSKCLIKRKGVSK